jgi:hypothetical protein
VQRVECREKRDADVKPVQGAECGEKRDAGDEPALLFKGRRQNPVSRRKSNSRFQKRPHGPFFMNYA